MKRFRGTMPASRVALGLAFALISACGTDKVEKPQASGQNTDDTMADGGQDAHANEAPRDHLVIPPQEYYHALFQEQMALVDQDASTAAAKQPQVLWVNFDGASLNKGFARGQSFILCKASATVPASNVSAADRSKIMTMVAAHYTKAGAKIVLTMSKPSSGDYTTIHVGGAYRDLGCLGAGVLGIAPFDRGNTNRNDIGFAFTPNGVTAKVIAETISHEAGHSFGLDHVTDRTDIMYASSSPTVDKFGVAKIQGSAKTQDAPAILQSVLGLADSSTSPIPDPNEGNTTTPTPSPGNNNGSGGGSNNGPIAQVPGLDHLGDLAKLLPNIGNLSLPNLQNLLPALDQLLPGLAGGLGSGGLIGSALPGLDKIIALNNLLQGQPGQGRNLPSVADLLKMLLQGIPGLSNGTLPNLPDLTNLAGLGSGPIDPASLVLGFPLAAASIDQNYSGNERDALLSLMKVAYAQALAKAGASTP